MLKLSERIKVALPYVSRKVIRKQEIKKAKRKYLKELERIKEQLIIANEIAIGARREEKNALIKLRDARLEIDQLKQQLNFNKVEIEKLNNSSANDQRTTLRLVVDNKNLQDKNVYEERNSASLN